MEVITICMPVIAMLIIGAVCRKMRLFSHEGVDALKSFAVNIGLPAVLINAFATMEYSVNNIIITALMFGICVAAHYLGKVLRVLLREPSPYLPFLTTVFEAGMVGYALFPILYPNEDIGGFAAIDLGQTLFAFTMFRMLVSVQSTGEKVTARKIVDQMIHSPVIIAMAVGVLMGATGLYDALYPSGIAGVIDSCTDFIGAPVGAVILFTIGYNLVFSEISLSSIGRTIIARIIIMIPLRIVAGLVVSFLGMGDYLNPALNLMFILPPPYVLQVFANDDSQQTYISSVVSVYTLLSVGAFMVLAALGA